ncbi:sulfite dehydrogenase (cytochrome) subunit SorA apoprotein [Humitalea rosea]|uniref:Sulfite dehydrogenase (Cytochrome) subunit SorA apoprotein n=1 Tax=Humitalea rosea TaxID=990373 RepID=A0A2W7KQC9_9PROT|nr:sulfite oxidase [Humitalea rosea]PZW50800.1 sulfite dehydrogenase (cytochrome) subunit SorA apoprotein [Humitalea rosea]
MTRERSLSELHADDPQRADALIWGRRGTLRGAALAAMGASLGATIPFADRMPAGLLPAALAQGTAAPATLQMEGKAALIILGERPLVAETPEVMLDDAITPTDKFFIRNNGQIPPPFAGDPKSWKLRIDGEVNTPLDLTIGELESRFPLVTRQLQMECGGNGRNAFVPPASGNQWGNGAISNAEWTGVRLRDLLAAAGPKETAHFTGQFGADPHLSGAADRAAMSRGMPIAKAMDEDTLICTRLNGAAIPNIHGAPLRMVVPGWPGSLSQKWMTRLTLLPVPHTGQGMGGTSYRVPVRPIVPGSRNNGAEFADLTSMPVRSILTSHGHGARLPAGTRALELRGAAWAGDLTVRAVDASLDYGASWVPMQVADPANRHAWQRWTGRIALPSDGYFEIWTRATDAQGKMQPHAAANWNPQGYGANAIGRAAILVG